MGEILQVSPNLLFGLLALNLIVAIVLLVLGISNRHKIVKLQSKYNTFMNGLSECNLEELLMEYINKVNKADMKNKVIENRLNDIERSILKCVQKIGIVRFNAFDDVGSDLSFSVAFLDENDDGVVFSGIYSRESSCTYAKPVSFGNSKYSLSAEEIEAINIAKKDGRSSAYM